MAETLEAGIKRVVGPANGCPACFYNIGHNGPKILSYTFLHGHMHTRTDRKKQTQKTLCLIKQGSEEVDKHGYIDLWNALNQEGLNGGRETDRPC